jgi:hypothetical protein
MSVVIDRPRCRPNAGLTSAAIARDCWRAFLDAKILWLLLAAILILFGIALTARITPRPAGRGALEISAAALAADLEDADQVDLVATDLASLAKRLDGSLSWIVSAEPIPTAGTTTGISGRAENGQAESPAMSWRVTLSRSRLPWTGDDGAERAILERFGRLGGARLWRARDVEETTGGFGRLTGTRTFTFIADPGEDLRLVWPHRFTLFGDTLELTRSEGAPLGLEVLILQKLLSTGIGGTILLLVGIAITAAFVPNMLRRGTLELLLVRPIPRWQLVVFTFLPGTLFVSALLGVLVFATWLVTGLLAGVWSTGIVVALSSLVLFFMLVHSVSVLAGVVTRSPQAAMLVAVAYWAVLFLVGTMHAQVVASRLRAENEGRPRPTGVADLLRGRKPEMEKPLPPGRTPFHESLIGRTADLVYLVLPRTEDLDTMVDRQLVRDFAVGGRLQRLVESGAFSWTGGIGLTLLHTLVHLAAACAVFTLRDP